MTATYRVRITSTNAMRQYHDLKATGLMAAKREASSAHAASVPFGGRMWLEEPSGATWRRVAYRETRHNAPLTAWKPVR